MSDSESEQYDERCSQCFRIGIFKDGEICDGCANIDEYYDFCQYCNKINYSTVGNICDKCYEIVKKMNEK